jgi:beta-lactamase regulating signal transducer with metallopeptidase domain
MSPALLEGSLFAVTALGASVILPLLAWLLCRLQAERAARRHLIWLAVFVALLLLPVLALLVPPQFSVHHVAGVSFDPSPAVVHADGVPVPLVTNTHLVQALAWIWAAGLGWNLARIAMGLHGLDRLRRTGTRFDAGLACDVRLAATGPLTFGWFKPVILLPLDAPAWAPARLEAVLGHEWAHVHRRDTLSNGLALLACAFYWPNPLVWWARRAMCQAAEIAADNRALAGGMKPSAYAGELVALTMTRHGQVSTAALAMASPSWVETRVAALLSTTQSRGDATAREVAAIAGLASAAALVLALGRPAVTQLPAAAHRPEAPSSFAMTARPSDSLRVRPERAGTAPARPLMPVKREHLEADRVGRGETGTYDSDAARDGLAASSHQPDADLVRAARLSLERVEREERLQQEAVQRRITLDAKFAQAKVDRDQRLTIEAAERAARLTEKMAAKGFAPHPS